jgi:hypothetical protein
MWLGASFLVGLIKSNEKYVEKMSSEVFRIQFSISIEDLPEEARSHFKTFCDKVGPLNSPELIGDARLQASKSILPAWYKVRNNIHAIAEGFIVRDKTLMRYFHESALSEFSQFKDFAFRLSTDIYKLLSMVKYKVIEDRLHETQAELEQSRDEVKKLETQVDEKTEAISRYSDGIKLINRAYDQLSDELGCFKSLIRSHVPKGTYDEIIAILDIRKRLFNHRFDTKSIDERAKINELLGVEDVDSDSDEDSDEDDSEAASDVEVDAEPDAEAEAEAGSDAEADAEAEPGSSTSTMDLEVDELLDEYSMRISALSSHDAEGLMDTVKCAIRRQPLTLRNLEYWYGLTQAVLEKIERVRNRLNHEWWDHDEDIFRELWPP